MEENKTLSARTQMEVGTFGLPGKNSMRLWTGLLTLWLLCPLGKGWAQPTPGVVYLPYKQFKVPFNVPAGAETVLDKIELYVSTNEGQSWDYASAASPRDKSFPTYQARGEGLHWFAVKMLRTSGPPYPAENSQLKAMLQIMVDWTAPVVKLKPLQPRGSEVGVSWDIRETHFAPSLPDALRLEYRPSGSGLAWTPLIVAPGINSHYWTPNFPGSVEVRLTARDRAGNPGVDFVTLPISLFTGGDSFKPAVPPPGSPTTLPMEIPGSPAMADRHFVNHTSVVLDFTLEDVGRSGVKKLQLWYTTDLGRTWETMPEAPYEPGDGGRNRLAFNVPKEGLYGVTIIAKSGADLGDSPPQPGEKPQKWIDVDLTPPTVKLDRVKVGVGPDKGKVTIEWTARDNKQLHAAPIQIYFSPKLSDPGARDWRPITPARIANLGSYTWVMPTGDAVPYEFYVKVEAVDLAENKGSDDRRDIVNVDLSRPRTRIGAVTAQPQP